jgi:hypothetical protein
VIPQAINTLVANHNGSMVIDVVKLFVFKLIDWENEILRASEPAKLAVLSPLVSTSLLNFLKR